MTNDVIFTACVKNAFSSVVQRSYGSGLTLKFGLNGEIVVQHWDWKHSIYSYVIVLSRHAPKRQEDLNFLSLMTYHCSIGIWKHILLFICHIALKMEKSYSSSNDDVINLKAMIKDTFSSILKVLWPVALKFGILESLILLISNNKKFISKSKIHLHTFAE